MSILLNKINKYTKNSFQKHAELYKGLANGQSPHTLLITCSDSRLCPSEFSETSGGELFVIRNAGNLMPTYNAEAPSNEGLTLEYGVCALGIKEVIVCGHKSCGAMGGLMDTSKLSSLPLVQKGLEGFKEQHRSDVEAIDDLDDLISWNVETQILSIASYPFIKERLEKGELTVQGIVYDFTKGSAFEVAKLDENGKISN
jgi:carbonic anhydrase